MSSFSSYKDKNNALPQLKVGLIGFGHIGIVHLKAIKNAKRLNLLAICDQDCKVQKYIPQHVQFFKNQKDFFKQDLDVIVIATPNNSHFTLAVEALKAGHNIILEKPAATSLSEFYKLLSVAKKNNGHLYFSFHAAKGMEVEWFKRWLFNREDLGEIIGFRSSFIDPYLNSNGQIVSHALSLGDCWMDSGINALSIINEFLDIFTIQTENNSFFKQTNNKPITCAKVEYFFKTSKSKNYKTGIIHTAWQTKINQKKTILFYEDKTYVILDHSQQQVLLNKDNNTILLADFSQNGERLYNHYINLFSDYLLCRRHNCFPWNNAIRVHELLYEPYREYEQ